MTVLQEEEKTRRARTLVEIIKSKYQYADEAAKDYIRQNASTMRDEFDSWIDEKYHSELAYEITVNGQAVRVSKKLDAAVEKISRGFYSLKEACEEAYKVCKEEGIDELLISDIIRLVLKRRGISNGNVSRYLPNYLRHQKTIREKTTRHLSSIDGDRIEESSPADRTAVFVQAEQSEDYKSLYEAEKQKLENLEVQFSEASFKKASLVLQEEAKNPEIESLRKMLAQKNQDIFEISKQKYEVEQEFENYKNDVRNTAEFAKAQRQTEIAYEDEVNRWKSEYEEANDKFRDLNRQPKIVEFSPGRLKSLDLIFENQDGILYLQHDGYKVIKVTAVKPVEQGGEIVG